ncbi:MAG TPA: caspase family protein [Longimicrobium sp.]|jgi:hypothetical protein
MSIHIGVNRPHGPEGGRPLQYSEATAWRMAELATRAGYDSLQVLRGAAATRAAVHQALTGAAGALGAGDTLLLTFSGHGVRVRDEDADERDGLDEAWCLADTVMMDDTLAGYWSLFERGVRIVVVSESCYGGGMGRTGMDLELPAGGRAGAGIAPVRWRGQALSVDALAGNPCIAEPPRHHDGIRASVLLLCAAGETEPARDGVFTRFLLDLWDDGAFRGSYCDLYRLLRQRVTCESPQQMQIAMMGAPDPGFSMAPAFHVDRTGQTGGRGGALRAG